MPPSRSLARCVHIVIVHPHGPNPRAAGRPAHPHGRVLDVGKTRPHDESGVLDPRRPGSLILAMLRRPTDPRTRLAMTKNVEAPPDVLLTARGSAPIADARLRN